MREILSVACGILALCYKELNTLVVSLIKRIVRLV